MKKPGIQAIRLAVAVTLFLSTLGLAAQAPGPAAVGQQLEVERHSTWDRPFWDQPALPIMAVVLGFAVVVIAGLFIFNRRLKREMRQRRRMERRFLSFMDNLPGMAYMRDGRGRYLYYNTEFEKAMKVETQDWIGRSVEEVLSPENAAGLREIDRKVLNEGTVSVVESAIPLQPEAKNWLSIRFPILGENGRPELLGGIAFDISESKRLQRDYARQAYMLRERVKELNCLYGLSRLVEQDGMSIEELLQATTGLIPPAWQYPDITRARIEYRGFEYETEGFRETPWAQVSTIWVNGKALGRLLVCYLAQRPESDEGPFMQEERNLIDAVAQRLGHALEQKWADEALRESESRYRNLFDYANDSIFILDPQTGKFLDVNENAAMRLGYSRAELLQLSTADISAAGGGGQTSQREGMLNEKPDGALDENGGAIFETVHRKKNGAEMPVEISRRLLDHGGRRVFLSISRDITERKRTQAELQQARDTAERASRAKSEFLANMSHELRTPLNAIIGFAQVLQEQVFGKLENRQAEYAGDILDSGRHLLDLINDILDFSKIEAGKLELESAVFNLEETLVSVAKMFQRHAEKKGLGFDYHADPDVPKYILGDALRIRQVLLNLLNNAVKFTRKGSIRFEVGVRKRGGNGPRLGIRISDTGIGIDRGKLAAIFDSFAQADNSTARQFGGSGLGLAISKRLVEMMKGRISVESAPGKGSVFDFDLPLNLPLSGPYRKEQYSAPGLADRPGPMRLKILVAEDDPVNRKLIDVLLGSMKYELVSANDGAEAVGLYRNGDFDLILMDIQMPKMNGYEATRKIRELEKTTGKRTPVVAITARALNGDRELSLKAGMDGHVTKPFTKADLVKEISRLVTGKR